MDNTFDFDEPFQLKVLGLLFTGSLSSASLEPHHFHNPILGEICESILHLRANYGILTPPMLQSHLLRKKAFQDPDDKEELLLVLPDVFVPILVSEQAYVRDGVRQFIRVRQYHQRVRQAVDLFQNGDTDILTKLDSIFQTPIPTGDQTNPGSYYFSSLPERLTRRLKRPNVLRSLIPALDESLKYGGFANQCICVFVGLLSTGKSFSTLHMALASILQAKKTVFYSLEMSEEEVTDRLDASLSGIKTYDLRDHAEEVNRAITLRKSLFGDNLFIQPMRSGQTKISDIRAHLRYLEQTDFVPEVVVLDHMNLMHPERLSQEGRHRDLGSVYVDLKGLAQERNLWVFTAHQANRLGYRVDVLTNEHIAHSLEGPQNATYVITINRTDEEAQEGKARLYIAKDQVGMDKKIIPISTDYARGAFFTRRARV